MNQLAQSGLPPTTDNYNQIRQAMMQGGWSGGAQPFTPEMRKRGWRMGAIPSFDEGQVQGEQQAAEQQVQGDLPPDDEDALDGGVDEAAEGDYLDKMAGDGKVAAKPAAKQVASTQSPANKKGLKTESPEGESYDPSTDNTPSADVGDQVTGKPVPDYVDNKGSWIADALAALVGGGGAAVGINQFLKSKQAPVEAPPEEPMKLLPKPRYRVKAGSNKSEQAIPMGDETGAGPGDPEFVDKVNSGYAKAKTEGRVGRPKAGGARGRAQAAIAARRLGQ